MSTISRFQRHSVPRSLGPSCAQLKGRSATDFAGLKPRELNELIADHLLTAVFAIEPAVAKVDVVAETELAKELRDVHFVAPLRALGMEENWRS